jgi:dTDP-4-amino-4,6-dideoxygalactose transaminase
VKALIPRLRPWLSIAELGAALAFWRTGAVERYEREFAAKFGQRYGVAFPYGRTALIGILKALGLDGREIICPAYTCVVVPHAIVTSGNEPVFVDSKLPDFNMDLSCALELITPRTGAIIATSIFGYPVDLGGLATIKARYPQLPIIQDCAHSFGAAYRGQLVNKAGLAAFFGLNISKIINSVFGGMVTTDDAAFAEKLRAVRQSLIRPPTVAKSIKRFLYLLAVYPAFERHVYGLVNWLERRRFLDRFTQYYDDATIAMPGDYLEGFTEMEARVGAAQLRKYDDVMARRRQTAAFYDRELRGLRQLELPPLVEGATYSHYVPTTDHRALFLTEGLRRGVQFGQLIEYNIPEMAAYRGRVGAAGDFPVASRLARRTINLPVSVTMSEAEKVVGVVRDICHKRESLAARKS